MIKVPRGKTCFDDKRKRGRDFSFILEYHALGHRVGKIMETFLFNFFLFLFCLLLFLCPPSIQMYWAGSSGCPPIYDLFNSRYGQLNLQEKERKNMKYIRFWLYVIFWVFVLQKAKCREKYIWFRLHVILCPI